MNTDAQHWIILGLLVVGIFSAGLVYYNPSDPATWCERFKPPFNTSLMDKDVAYCYGDGWSEYCKISYPDNCPSSDKLSYTNNKEEQ